MSNVAISVEGLGKRYQIGTGPKEPYGSLRDSLARAAKAPINRLRRSDRADSAAQDYWALKDVSFEVKHGEAVGIIGRNGAGKSTLLKVLSRITEPTTGQAVVHGRVGSLLEVGTGFHPELTGRENIYLNGAVMGMSRSDIKRHFDEIVDFAGVETYLDTPVKRYSSGMYMRLAFAVAAHLEPEILVVDEVLAVGDAGFQRKCLGKMQDVSAAGRAVIFVSHQMQTIEHLCSKAIMLDGGRLAFEGDTRNAIKRHLESSREAIQRGLLRDREDRSGSGTVRLTDFYLEDVGGNELVAVQSGDDLHIVLPFVAKPDARNVDVGISLHDEVGRSLTVLYAGYLNQTFASVPTSGAFRCQLRNLPLTTGRYKVAARVLTNGVEADFPKDGIGFIDVEDGDFYRTGRKCVDGATVMMLNGGWSLREPQIDGRHVEVQRRGA